MNDYLNKMTHSNRRILVEVAGELGELRVKVKKQHRQITWLTAAFLVLAAGLLQWVFIFNNILVQVGP